MEQCGDTLAASSVGILSVLKLQRGGIAQRQCPGGRRIHNTHHRQRFNQHAPLRLVIKGPLEGAAIGYQGSAPKAFGVNSQPSAISAQCRSARVFWVEGKSYFEFRKRLLQDLSERVWKVPISGEFVELPPPVSAYCVNCWPLADNRDGA